MHPTHTAEPSGTPTPIPVDGETFPCPFLIEVQEGYATTSIESADQLKQVLDYCRREGYTVRRLAPSSDDEPDRRSARYVASRTPLDGPVPGAVTAQASPAS